MTRKKIRIGLMAALVISAGFSAWVWFRPYQWAAPDAAESEIVGCMVEQDRSYYWLNLHLKMEPGDEHDLMEPVRLVTADGRELKPADTTKGGIKGAEMTDLWLKFWLDRDDLNGALQLKINDGLLSVRTGEGVPDLGRSGLKNFLTHRW